MAAHILRVVERKRFFQLAEELAAREMRRRGFAARLTQPGRDGGLDVVDPAAGLAVQVKATQYPVGRPVLQQLVGASPGARRRVCVSLAAYSSEATAYARTHDIALFRFNLDDRIYAINPAAESLAAPGCHPTPIEAARSTAGAAASDSAAHDLARRIEENKARNEEANEYSRGASRARRAKADAMEAAAVEGPRLEQIGDGLEAEAVYRSAAVLGNRDAMVRLSEMLRARGIRGEAKQWAEKAARAEADVMPRAPESERPPAPPPHRPAPQSTSVDVRKEAALRAAAIRGDREAMLDLSARLRARGIQGEAEQWERKAFP